MRELQKLGNDQFLKISIFVAMGRIVVLLLVLLSGSLTAQETWFRSYGQTLDDEGVRLLKPDDEGLIIVGNTTNFGTGLTEGIVFKVNLEGEILWSSTLGTPKVDWFADACLNEDGSIVIVGTTLGSGAGAYDVLVAQFSAEGELLQHTTLGDGDWNFGGSIAPAGNNSLIVTSRTEHLDARGDQTFMHRLNSSLIEIAVQDVGTAGDDAIHKIRLSPNGQLVSVGYQTVSGQKDAWLAGWSQTMALQWEEFSGLPNDDEMIGVDFYDDGRIATCGYFIAEGQSTHDFTLSLRTEEGQETWAYFLNSMSNTNFSNNDELLDVIVKENDRICAVGRSQFNSATYDLIVYERTVTNSFTLVTLNGVEGDDQGYGIVEMPEFGHVTVGKSNSYSDGNDDIIMIREDISGSDPTNEPVAFDLTVDNQFLRVAEEDIASTILVQSGDWINTNDGSQIVQIEIYDMVGRQLWFSNGSIADFSLKGQFLCKATVQQESATEKVIVQLLHF